MSFFSSKPKPPADWIDADDASTLDFLKRGGDANARDRDGGTALMAAAMRGSTSLIRELISKGAAVNATDSTGVTALMIASARGHVIAIEDLLRAGANVNARKPREHDGSTALHLAVQHDHRDAAEALLDAGANPDAENSGGVTPLMVAAHFGNAPLQVILRRYAAR